MFISLTFKHILVLSPHTDDAELGCGGMLAKYDCRKTVVAFSRPKDCKEQITEEWKNALSLLECEFELRNFPIREMQSHRQQILDNLIDLRDKYEPDAVLIPASTDTHQDHEVIANEAKRAFKGCTILGYELPWNHYEFTNTGYVELSKCNMDAKWQALQCYQSQSERPYFDREHVYGLGRVRGVQCKAPYGEAFEVVRVIL